jgi:hypothetical protein
MEATKRTYQKHKKEYKITVKHYLNKTVNEYDNFGNRVYPFYVQVTHKSKNTRFRSRINPISAYFFDIEEIHFSDSTIDMSKDTAFIIFLINSYEKYNIENGDAEGGYDVSDLASFYHSENYNLVNYIEYCLKNEIGDLISDNANEGFQYDILSDIKALTYFEYLKDRYPFLKLLKEKYTSNIWIFDIYVEQMRHGQNLELGIGWDIDTGVSMIPNNPWKPTIQDYKAKFIQKELLLYFNDSPEIIKIFEDIDKLFSKVNFEYVLL